MKKRLPLLAAGLLAVSATPVASADDTPMTSTPTRTIAPNTDDCPNSATPPEPTTTSEQLAPGQAPPEELPVLADGECGVTAPAGFRVPEEVLASSWIVADLDSREVIAQKDPHGRYRPASVIKALLALVAIEKLDLRQKVTVSHESAAQVGSAVGIGEGGTYTVEQLLQGLLMASGNDAAHALAQELGGDEVALRLVNEKAAALGTTDTRVATYSGLDAPGMSSSAFDLGIIYAAAFADPTFARLVGTEKVDFPGYDDHEGYELWNDNGLFMNDPDGIGGKTGFTDDANHTFVGALDRDGRRLVAVVLDTTVDKARAWQQAQGLLDEAYTVPAGSGVGTLTPIQRAETLTPTPVPPPAETTNDRDLPIVGISVIAAVAALGVVAATMVRRR